MKNYLSRLLTCLSLSIILQTSQVSAETTGNPQPLSVRLCGHIPEYAIDHATYLKDLDGTAPLPITFTLPLRNQRELEELVLRIHDPNDQQYFGKYLTSEEFVNRFAPTQENYDRVIAYVNKLGLTISNTHPNRTLVNVTGSVGSIEKAFNLHLRQYQMSSGRTFYAPDNNPEVDLSVAPFISGIVGLDNQTVWHSYHRQKKVKPESAEGHQITHTTTFPSGPGGGFSPHDLVTAYNLSGIEANGSGQTIALFELASYQESDINNYTSYFGLPQAALTNILVDGGSNSGIDPEVTLDIELALALAPQSQIYVYEGPNSSQGVLDTYNRIATDNIAKQVSTSWGVGEDLESVQYIQQENAIFLQMAAQGQTIYAAAGDSGAYDDSNDSAPVVDDPASQPYVVGVGGTRLTVNSETGAYESESVWNNGAGNGAGGGGVSVVWPIPSWQANVSTAYSKTHRNVPDVALNADPDTGYSIYYDGQWNIYGGTSCAAPLWASFTALVNQERTNTQTPTLGFANPLLYSLAEGSYYTTDFHDVITGNNLYYAAGVGYDNASGWGSFNGSNLFASLTNTSPTPPPPPPPPPMVSPVLTMDLKHNAPFIKKRMGTYEIIVTNNGTDSTSGNVSVAVTIPNGLTYRSFSGSGWIFNSRTFTFTRSDVLKPGESYPKITLNVIVAKNAPSSVIFKAAVSGGGSAASTAANLTTIR